MKELSTRKKVELPETTYLKWMASKSLPSRINRNGVRSARKENMMFVLSKALESVWVVLNESEKNSEVAGMVVTLKRFA